MKRPLLFAFIAIALLYAVRAFEYAGLRKNETGIFAKLRLAFEEKNNFNLVILGSSRAESQYYTPHIDSATGLRSYNLGMTGAVLPFMRATLEAYLVHSNPPQYVVLNLDLHSFSDNPDTVYNFPRYFAYLDNEKLYEGLKSRDKRFFFFKYFPFYSMPYYTSRYFNSSIRGWIGKPGKYDADYESGFAPEPVNPRLGDYDTMSIRIFNHPAPDFAWTELHKIDSICRKNGSKLILVTSPLYYRWELHVINHSLLLAQFRDYAAEHKIAFIDLSHDPIRFDQELYADPAHLNKQGAMVFTRHFCDSLGQYIRH
jgi:hypothetical protein